MKDQKAVAQIASRTNEPKLVNRRPTISLQVPTLEGRTTTLAKDKRADKKFSLKGHGSSRQEWRIFQQQDQKKFRIPK